MLTLHARLLGVHLFSPYIHAYVKFAPSSRHAVGAATEDRWVYVAAPPTSPCSHVLYTSLFAKSGSIAWSKNEITIVNNETQKKHVMTMTLHTSSNELQNCNDVVLVIVKILPQNSLVHGSTMHVSNPRALTVQWSLGRPSVANPRLLKGAEDNVSAPSAFIANSQNLITGKGGLLGKNYEPIVGTTAPPPPWIRHCLLPAKSGSAAALTGKQCLPPRRNILSKFLKMPRLGRYPQGLKRNAGHKRNVRRSAFNAGAALAALTAAVTACCNSTCRPICRTHLPTERQFAANLILALILTLTLLPNSTQ